jgi:hypothetical protein
MKYQIKSEIRGPNSIDQSHFIMEKQLYSLRQLMQCLNCMVRE